MDAAFNRPDLTGATLYLVIDRQSDAFFFNVAGNSFDSAAYSATDHKTNGTEGSGIFVGSWKFTVAGSNLTGAIRGRIFNASASDALVGGFATYCIGGVECSPADLLYWRGTQPDALSSGKLPADVKLWQTGTPAALSATSYVQVDCVKWLAGTIPAPGTTGVPSVDPIKWATQTIPTPIQTGVPIVDAKYAGTGSVALAAPNSNGFFIADVRYWGGAASAVTFNVSGRPLVDVGLHLGTVCATPTVAGIPKVEVSSTVSGALTSTSFATGSLTAAALAADAANEIADAVLSRSVSNVEATASTSSLCYLVLSQREASMSGTTLTVFQTDGTTVFDTRTFARETASVLPVKSLT